MPNTQQLSELKLKKELGDIVAYVDSIFFQSIEM
jgi:hypothetical protein